MSNSVALDWGFEFQKTNRDRAAERGGEEEEDDDDDGGEADLAAWERAYADERSWESLQEDESGLLRPIDNKSAHLAQYRRRIRSLSSSASRIQKGLIRFLYLVVDLSRVKDLPLSVSPAISIFFFTSSKTSSFLGFDCKRFRKNHVLLVPIHLVMTNDREEIIKHRAKEVIDGQ